VNDLRPGQIFPVHLVDVNTVATADHGGTVSVTPVFAGAGANGGLLVEGVEGGPQYVVAQGNGFNGNDRTSPDLLASADQLPIALDGLLEVDEEDLLGIGEKRPDTLAGQLNLVNAALVAYTGLLPNPGQAAFWVGEGLEARGLSDNELATDLRTSPGTEDLVTAHFGGDLEQVSVEDILGITTETLWGREARGDEVIFWTRQVEKGLSRNRLPMAVLQSSEGDDLYRLAFLLASAQWSNGQWAISANIDGSTGLGLSADIGRFALISDQVLEAGTFSGFDAAQAAFDERLPEWLAILSGTEISDSGFF
jgi:hypothetical protein